MRRGIFGEPGASLSREIGTGKRIGDHALIENLGAVPVTKPILNEEPVKQISLQVPTRALRLFSGIVAKSFIGKNH